MAASASPSPLLPYLQPPFPTRAFASVRSSGTRGEQSRPVNRSLCYPTSLTGGQIDHALNTVRNDIRQLWIRSKYRRDFPGIVTYSQELDRKDSVSKAVHREQSLESQSPPPFLVTVQTKKVQVWGRYRSRYDYLPHRPTATLKVSLPSPVKPAVKQSQSIYKLRKIPAPLGICDKYRKRGSLSQSMMGYSNGSVAEEIQSPWNKEDLEGTETCPLTALRSYETEKKDDNSSKSFSLITQKSMEDCLIPPSPHVPKGTLFAKTRKFKVTKRRQKGLSLNEIPMKVTQIRRKSQRRELASAHKGRNQSSDYPAYHHGKPKHPPLPTPHSDHALLIHSSLR